MEKSSSVNVDQQTAAALPVKEIQIFNRKKNRPEIEKIYGEKFLRWLYESPMGKSISPFLIHPLLSRAYGFLQDVAWSQKKIAPFVEKFQIPLDDFLPEENRSANDPYSTFNEFFIRRFKEGKRIFTQQKDQLAAFAEGRYLAYEHIAGEEKFPVKGKFLTANKILKDPKWNKVFNGGPLIIARLCPVDYHRFHFPDDGKMVDFYKVKGKLHSVNPLALSKYDEVFCENERHVTILETKNFGLLAYVEVGAICVGKIVQSKRFSTDHKNGRNSFKRGDEKGYFLFGGSTVILLGQKGKWRPDEDILKKTQESIETFIELGDSVGRAI